MEIFNVGDKVEVVNADPESWFSDGQIFTIKEVLQNTVDSSYGDYLISLEEDRNVNPGYRKTFYYSCYFKHINTIKEKLIDNKEHYEL